MAGELPGLFLLGQMRAVRKRDRGQVLRDVTPDRGHVEQVTYGLEIFSPQGQHRAGQLPMFVFAVLRDVLLARSVIAAGAGDRAGLLIRPLVLGQLLGGEKLGILGPRDQEMSQPERLPPCEL